MGDNENSLIGFEASYCEPLAGVDEVGRGPLAGPVIAAAVILDKQNIPDGIKDSKKITKTKMSFIAEQIKKNSIFAFGSSSVKEIDKINILQASLLAMKRAIESLKKIPKIVLVDGIYVPNIGLDILPIKGGDNKSISIAAASIIAKDHRDKLMLNYSKIYPDYRFEKNSGYGTKEHLLAIQKYGITPIHRKSFSPIHKILN